MSVTDSGSTTSEIRLSPGDRRRCLVLLIAALSVVSMTSSLVWPILAESLSNKGYSETEISISAAVQFAGIAIVSLVATRFIPMLGILGSIGAGLVLVAIALIGLPLWRDYTAWCALRFLLGIGNALLFTAGDTWINQILDDRVRGRWMGIYTTVGMAGWAVGPVVGASLDPETAWPFLIGLSSVLITSALLLPTRRLTFTFPVEDRAHSGIGRLMIVFLAAPTVLMSSAMFGILEGGLQSFAHLYTMDVLGEEFRQTGYAVIWVGSVGAIFFQYPVGWLADRVHRGWLLVGCVFVIAACLAPLPWLLHGGAGPWWTAPGLLLWSVIVVWGGAMGAVFTVGITLLGQRFRSVDLVAANAVFSLLFGIGGMAGPLMVGMSMDEFGPHGFVGSLIIAVILYGCFAAARQFIRR